MLNNKFISRIAPAVSLLLFICACEEPSYKVTHVEARHIEISPTTPSSQDMDNHLSPMIDSMSAVMDKVISHSEQYADKRGGALGAWLADVSIEEVENYMDKNGQRVKIDVALFNSGGMRTQMPKGDITVGWVYELMPFDNSYVILEMDNAAMREMFKYLSSAASRGTYHPLSGMRMVYDKNGNWDRTTTIGQWRLTPGKTYTVLTSDFLHKGGDGMAFFSHGTNVRYLPLKMRDAIMDYVTSHDTLKIPQNPRYYEIK